MTTEREDKRRAGRMRTILAAHANLGQGLPPVPCQVRDISETGARITIDEAVTLPDRFELAIPKKNMLKAARVRWRQGTGLGIEFLEERKIARTPDPEDRIKALEIENAELRRRIAELSERLFNYGDSERYRNGDLF